MQVTEAYYKWQDEYWTIPGNLLENTTRGYLSIFERHLLPNIGENSIDAIDLDKLQEYFNSLSKEGYSPKTLRNITQALDSLLSWCWTRRIVKMPINIKPWITFPKKEVATTSKTPLPLTNTWFCFRIFQDTLRQYRTKIVPQMRCQIFRQIVQKFRRHTDVCRGISVQDDGKYASRLSDAPRSGAKGER